MVPEIFLVPHTHWDREWYEPFDRFRERLVEMMESLVSLTSADPPFAHFHLDGQSAMIDDYLEVHPEREPDIRKMAADGRISVGPWFTQMDEFLTSGESMIRNLEWGLARAASFGAERPLAGYLPDQFGHIGQMPQILRNAGIDRAVLWRGVPAAIDTTSFVWESPDGSSVLTEYLAFGYSFGWHINQVGTARELAVALRQAAELLTPSAVEPDRLLIMVGGDHQVPAARLTPLLEELSAEGVRAHIGPLDAYLSGQDLDAGTLPRHRGELRSAARAHLLPNVYSARPHQKLARANVEAALERWAEPLSALVPGVEWPAAQLERAWRLLLWNGAHDSVCGCSVDRVAQDVDARYDEGASLAGDISDRAAELLAGRMSSRGWMLLNPSPFAREDVPPLGWRIVPDDQAGPPWRTPDPSPTTFHPPVSLHPGDGRISGGGWRIRLLDEADIGDLYSFCPADPPERHEPTSFEVRSLEEAPAVSGADDLSTVLTGRFGEDLEVDVWAERHPEDRYLMLSIRVTNRRPDHRLRLHVGLDHPAEHSVALIPFEVLERPLRSEGGTETPSPTWPARGAVSAGGVTVFHPAVFEYEVLPDEAEVAVTLMRRRGDDQPPGDRHPRLGRGSGHPDPRCPTPVPRVRRAAGAGPRRGGRAVGGRVGAASPSDPGGPGARRWRPARPGLAAGGRGRPALLGPAGGRRDRGPGLEPSAGDGDGQGRRP